MKVCQADLCYIGTDEYLNCDVGYMTYTGDKILWNLIHTSTQ